MIGQKSIHSFFSPVSKKRTSKDLSETDDEAKDAVSDASGSVDSVTARARFAQWQLTGVYM